MTFFAKLTAAIAAPLLLTGCLVTPGKFESEMVVQKNGEFAFFYEGEISVVGLQKLIKIAADSEEEEFEPTCYKDGDTEEASYRTWDAVQAMDDWERECTEEEAEEQRQDKQRENEKMMAMFQLLFGGVDPSTPDALEELVKRTRKQKGWEKIDHRGNGIFDVKYALRGRMDRNFIFPHFEQAKGGTAFVEAIVRKDGKVRIEAPGFAPMEENSGLMQLGTLAAMGEEEESDDIDFGEEEEVELPPGFTKPEGTFTISTDAEILTNNTEEGPETDGEMKVLRWDINQRTKAAPMALLRIDG